MEVVYSKFANFFKRTHIDDDILDIMIDENLAINFERKLDYEQTTGFLLQYSAQFLVIANFDLDFITTNGYNLIRRKDLTKINTFDQTNQDFFKTALELNNIRLMLPYQLPLNLTIKEVIIDLHNRLNNHPIMAFYTEKYQPNQYEAGIIENLETDISENFLKLKSIGENGNWDVNPIFISIDEITKIEWETQYLKILAQVNQSSEQEAENDEIVIENRLYLQSR